MVSSSPLEQIGDQSPGSTHRRREQMASTGNRALWKTSLMADKPDPTKDPEFLKVVRHFVTTPPKPHEKMRLGKSRTKGAEKANPMREEKR